MGTHLNPKLGDLKTHNSSSLGLSGFKNGNFESGSPWSQIADIKDPSGSLIDCLVIVCCLWGAITILTGELFEFTFATRCNGAGRINSWAFSIVIPACLTSGNCRNSESFTRTPLVTSALNL